MKRDWPTKLRKKILKFLKDWDTADELTQYDTADFLADAVELLREVHEFLSQNV